jgi:hypothetical protein
MKTINYKIKLLAYKIKLLAYKRCRNSKAQKQRLEDSLMSLKSVLTSM